MKLTEREKWIAEKSFKEGNHFGHCVMNCPKLSKALSDNEKRVEAEAPSNWIPVSERLPNSKTEVIVHRKDRGFWWGVLVKDNWYTRFGYGWDDVDDVTHWMPLPEPPTDSATGEGE